MMRCSLKLNQTQYSTESYVDYYKAVPFDSLQVHKLLFVLAMNYINFLIHSNN